MTSGGSVLNWQTGKEVLDHNGQPFRQREEAGPWAIPPAFQVAAIFNVAYKNFYHGRGDAALRDDPDFALKIEQDPHVQRVLSERTNGVLSLKLGLWVEDDRNPVNRAIRDNVWATMQETDYFEDMLRFLHGEASWTGKSAVQPVYEWRIRDRADPKNPQQKIPTRCPIITSWITTSGDSIGWRWSGVPYVLVNSTYGTELPNAEITNTNINRGVVLRGTWRDKFIIHRHRAGSIPYWHGERSEAIFGTGIRNVVYWLVWLRQQLVSNIVDYCQRTGLGVKVWRFQAGNEQSRLAVEAAAKQQIGDQANILLPTFPTASGKVAESIEVLNTSTQGSDLLLKFIQQWNDEIELFIIGQTLSSGSEGAGMSGSGIAKFHQDTKHQIISLDAKILAHSLTKEWVAKICAWQHPEYAARIPLRAEFETNPPNASEQIDNAIKIYGIGVEIPKNHLRKLAGVPAPDEGEEMVSLAQQQQQEAALNPPPVPGDGDGDGVGFEESREGPDTNYFGDSVMRELAGSEA